MSCCIFTLSALGAAAALAGADDGSRVFSGSSTRRQTETQARERHMSKARDAVMDVLDQYAPDNRGTSTRWVKRLIAADPWCSAPGAVRVLSGGEVQLELTEKRLDALWQEAEAFYATQMSGVAPTVAMMAHERIEENGPYLRITEHNKSESWVAQQVEEALLAQGFRVVYPRVVEERKHERAQWGELGDYDASTIMAMGSELQAGIVAVFYAHSIGPTLNDRHTPGKAMYYATGFAKGFLAWADTGEKIGSFDDSKNSRMEPNPNVTRIDALREVGGLLADKLPWEVWSQWTRWAFEGRTITLRIANCDDRQAGEIGEILERAAGLRPNSTRAPGMLKLEVPGVRVSASNLAEKLVTQASSRLTLRIEQATRHTAVLRVEN